jgi:hypothetical protein
MFKIILTSMNFCIRWQQAPDRIKGHEPQFWVPLNFDENGKIGKIQWVDEFILDV